MSDHKDWATPENLYRAADNADAAGFTEYGWKLQGSAERIESLWAEIESLQREIGRLEAARAAIASEKHRIQRENEAATQYASNLADELHRRFYPEVTGWTKLPDINGILSQIDNMTAGIAAITPEMRERIERKLADMQAESPLPIGGELVDLLRDLLGEQG